MFYKISLIVSILFCIISCSNDDDNNFILNGPDVGDLSEFEVNFFFGELDIWIRHDLHFEETATWEITCEKKIAHAAIYGHPWIFTRNCLLR